MDFTRTQLLRTDLLCGLKNEKNAIESMHSAGEKLSLTMPKRNADFRAKPKGLCIFMNSLNLMDLALEQQKNKTKQ
jgi:hypothetical protein